jgi:hypothetical protein
MSYNNLDNFEYETNNEEKSTIIDNDSCSEAYTAKNYNMSYSRMNIVGRRNNAIKKKSKCFLQ